MRERHVVRNRNGYTATPIVFALIPLLFVGGVLIFSRFRSAETPEIKPLAMQDDSNRDSLSIDSDHDGLKDWEEQIYGTDPHNPDSDGDGTKDGDEIAQGRDPLKPGPNDYLIQKAAADGPASHEASAYPNLTRKLAEVFGQDYLTKLIQNPASPQDVDAIADKMTQVAINASDSSAPALTRNDIIVIPQVSKDQIVHYLKQFDEILITAVGTAGNEKNILDLVADLMNKSADDPTDVLRTLSVRIDAYNSFLAAIKPLAVPEDFVSLHLQYLNTAIREREALKKIHAIKDDALLTVVGVRELIQTTKDFDNLRAQYLELQRQKGISAK